MPMQAFRVQGFSYAPRPLSKASSHTLLGCGVPIRSSLRNMSNMSIILLCYLPVNTGKACIYDEKEIVVS